MYYFLFLLLPLQGHTPYRNIINCQRMTDDCRASRRASGEAARGSLARSREAHFACPSKRACSQAMLRKKGVLIVVFKVSPCNNVVFWAHQFCV